MKKPKQFSHHYLVIWRPLRSNELADMKIIDSLSNNNKDLHDNRNQIEKDCADIYIREYGPGRIEVVRSNPNSLYHIE